MTPEALFKVANNIALLSWILLIILGRKRWVSALTTAIVVPGALAVAYALLLALHWSEASGGFQSLADVSTLFQNPWVLLVGWIHYLAFDLFVGTWEVRDAAANGISHWLIIPCLVLTFMFGPVGFLLYLLVRTALRRRLTIE